MGHIFLRMCLNSSAWNINVTFLRHPWGLSVCQILDAFGITHRIFSFSSLSLCPPSWLFFGHRNRIKLVGPGPCFGISKKLPGLCCRSRCSRIWLPCEMPTSFGLGLHKTTCLCLKIALGWKPSLENSRYQHPVPF